MTTIETARQWAEEARDDKWDKKCYALQRFMAGDPSYVTSLFQSGDISIAGMEGEDALEFPWTDPDIAMSGVQNHAYVNARINVQGIVYSTPEVMCSCQEPIIRKVNSDWFKLRYHNGGFASKLFEVGMDVQAFGIGFVDLGIGLDGAFTIKPRSKLDVLADPSARSPDGWRYIWTRDRLDYYQAQAKYGITEEEFNEYARRGLKRYDTTLGYKSLPTQSEPLYIYEWKFWTLEDHHVVLGSIKNKNCPMYVWSAKEAKYKRHYGDKSGENPYGLVPIATWVDSWMSGSLRPTGMLEPAWRAASMLNLIELSCRAVLTRSIPMTVLSAAGLSAETIKSISEAEGPDDIAKIIVTDLPEAAQSIQRTPAGEIPQTYLALYAMWKDHLNAATGVMDMQRGQSLGGRKTAQEIRSLEDNQGIQAHHARQRAAECLREVFLKGRKIAAKFETVRVHLEGDDYILDSQYDDISKLLDYPLDAIVDEGSLVHESAQARMERRLIQLNSIDLPAINAGVGDPAKIFADAYKAIGVVDPYSRMYTPEQMAQMQQAQQQSMMQEPDQYGEQYAEPESV